MTVRGKKLDIRPSETSEKEEKTEENFFEQAFQQASMPKDDENPIKTVEIGEKSVKPALKIEEETGNKPFDAPNAVILDKKPSVEEELKVILTVQRGKRAVPTLITFFSARSNAYRHVIVDVTDSIVEDAWVRYKELCPSPDEEEFMGLVYKILNTDIPRMYRAVATVTLKK